MSSTKTSISPAASSGKMRVEGVQSVIPLRPTHPRHTRKVTLKHPQTMGIFQKCHHVLLYYKKGSEEDSGWVFGGRLKESVGRALLEYPMIAGRLRWGDQKASLRHGGERELELVSNDSGIRLVEAKFFMSLDEFFVKKGREDVEGEFVFWEEVNEEDPQFCPLAYVQVTNFQCGGYSVGFSLSLVLGDTSELTSFIKLSAKLQKEIFQGSHEAPVFYLPKLKSNKFLPEPNGVRNRKQVGQTLLYTISVRNLDKKDSSMLKHITMSCIQDAEEKLCANMGLDFSMFFEDWRTGELSVEVGFNGGVVSHHLGSCSELRCNKWGETQLEDITFWERHRPAYVSHWIGLRESEGLVMVSSSKVEGSSRSMHVFVTIPHQK